MSAMHSAASGEWYTPASIVDAARETLGGIDLDPASCAAANARVRARAFGTLSEAPPWSEARTIFLNPPTPPRLWWERLTAWHAERPTERAAVYIAYSLQQLQQSLTWSGAPMLRHRVIFPFKRIAYDRTARQAVDVLASTGCLSGLEKLLALHPDTLVTGPHPPHAGAIVLLGAELDPRPLLAATKGIMK